jgi:hypothetical protein
MLPVMNLLSLAPDLEVSADRLHGCTARLARVLWLFSYARCVTVNRRSSHVIIATRRLWLWRQVRLIRFDQISRIVYRALAIPSLDVWRYLSLEDSDTSDSALFLISLALTDGGEELPLFTVWEEQPQPGDWLDELAGDQAAAPQIGDEAAGRVVELLSRYIGVRIAGR